MSERFALDASVRRSRDGLIVSGGQPARVLRLSPRGAAVLDAALGGATLRAGRDLLDRLTAYEMVHPVARPEAVQGVSLTFVIPVKDGASSIGALVAALVKLWPVIVVDDGSSDDSRGEAERAGARIVANADAPGPAGARNTGLALVGTELVAFIDCDCVPRPGWLDPLTGLLAARDLALVAPRVRSVDGNSAIARYERRCSPLDLGPHPGIVAPGRRVPFVPAAALVGRVAALREVSGFDGSLHVGEDVDLVWRLVARGSTVRYVPTAIVEHRPRGSLAAFARQRFRYGTSAAALDRRHPGAVAPLQVTPWRIAGGLAGSSPAVRLRAVMLAAQGQASLGRQLTRVLSREWLPLTLYALLRGGIVRRLAAAVFAIDAGCAYSTHLDPARFATLRLVDHGSYCAGVWWGVLTARAPGALLPRVGNAPTYRY